MTLYHGLAVTLLALCAFPAASDTGNDAPSGSPAQAFGLRFGTPIDELKKLGAKATKKPNRLGYEISPPVPHPHLETYRLNASRTDGLCEITAVLVEENGDGSRIYDAFISLRDGLKEKYGPSGDPDETDVAVDPTDDSLLMDKFASLDIGAPILWNFKGRARSPTDIGTIMLEIVGLNSKTAFVALSYDSANSKECHRNLTEEENSGL